jgi:hypothetical protein
MIGGAVARDCTPTPALRSASPPVLPPAAPSLLLGALSVLKLGISDHWVPNANSGVPVNLGIAVSTTGSLLRYYLWFHIIAGWVLTTLWVGGITGLVKT